jgi:hypothetical protein
MAQGNFQPTPRVKNALDNRKLSLSAPTPGVQGKYSSLIWGLYSNNPRITVYTNDPNDSDKSKNYGKITAALDLPVFMMLMNMINQAIDSPADVKFRIENKNYIFPAGKRSDHPVVVSELHVGKKDGVVWMSVTAKDRPRIQFKFHPSDFHAFQHGDGRPFTEAEASAIFARGYVRLLEEMMLHLAAENYTEPPPKDGGNSGGGGNRGGWNRDGAGGGGQSRPESTSDDKDDDLPF